MTRAKQIQPLSKGNIMSNSVSNKEQGLIDVKGLAELLCVSKRSIFRYASSGVLPKEVRFAGTVRWIRSDIEQWISMDCPHRKEFETRKGKTL
jgi:predicted DNA-binding transcriptional regulator AlpA